MPYRHFQIPSYGGETEAAMTQFLNQHRVLKVEKQFVNPLQPRPAGGGRDDGP